jgi:2'-5' RNA ligase
LNKPEESIRAFIALQVPAEIRRAAGEAIRTWGKSMEGVRWVKPENLHLTLKFLGQTSAGRAGEISRRLSESLEEFAPFTTRFRGVGALPSVKRPRVLFVDIDEGREKLMALSKQVDRNMTSLGFDPESRESLPHLTVGRIKYLKNRNGPTRWCQDNRDLILGSFRVEEVAFIRSELRPDGPVYTVLNICRLGYGGPPGRGEE